MQHNKYLSVLLVLVLSLSIVSGVSIAQSTENISDDNRYWVGQDLTYDVENGSNNAELVRGENETFVTELDVNNSTIDVNTTGYIEGDYNLTYSNSSDEEQSVQFELTNQDFNVTSSENRVTNESSTSINFSYESNRNDYNISVSSDNVSDSELATLFDVNESEVNESEVTVPSDSNRDINFTGFETGEYEFAFNVTDTDANDSVTVNVSDTPEPTVDIQESIVETAEGDQARFTLQYNGTNNTNVTIGNQSEVGYEISFGVENQQEDNDTVEVVFNTYHAGVNNTSSVLNTTDDDGSITVYNETNIESPRLSPATYDVTVDVNGEESDFAEVIVQERSTNNVRIKTLPNGTEVTGVSDLVGNDSQEVGSYTTEVAQNDTIAVEVDMSGVYGYLDEEQDPTELDNGLYIETTENTPNSDTGINLSGSNLYTNPAEDRFYVVLNATESNVNIGSDYTVEVGLNNSSDYVNETQEESVTTDVSILERNTEFTTNQNGTVEVTDENMIVTAETNVATGTETTLLVRNTDSPNLEEFDAVAEEGEFRVNISNASISQGDNFTVELRGETDEVDGTYLVSDDGSDDNTDEADGNDTDEGTDNTTDNTTDTDGDSGDSGGIVQSIIEFITGLIGL